MSNKTVFKKVMVADRLPKERIYVPTINTLGGIDTLYHISNGEFTDSHVSTNTLHYIEAWLEEIELPSEEDIFNQRFDYVPCITSFTKGANYILNKLK